MQKNKKIIMALLERGWTQRELARRSSIHETKLSAILNGWLNPSSDTMDRIASALGCKPSDLFR